MKKQQWLLGILVVAVFLSTTSYGQSGPGDSLSRQRWEELTKKLDYGEVTERPPQPDKSPPSAPIDGNGASALRILLFILAGAGVAILVAMLLGVGKPRDKNLNGNAIDITTLEEDLPGAELDDYLARALQQEDYRLAVRLHYLQLLQLLSEKEHILWKVDKTDREYLLETASHPWHNELETLTALFERIRYGRLRIDRPTYGAVRARFEALHQRIAQDKKSPV